MCKEKYKKRSMKSLHSLCTKVCNQYIRMRDEGKGCISCPCPTFHHAGHWYPVKGFTLLRYDEYCIAGQCRNCNYYGKGNYIFYTRNILTRISRYHFNRLNKIADQYVLDKRGGNTYEWQKSDIIDKIIYYQSKIKDIEDEQK